MQGYNVPFAGLLTMGESWHNNHHAFPGSARLGLYEGQWDPGWWVLRLLERFGLARDLVMPEMLPARAELSRRHGDASVVDAAAVPGEEASRVFGP